MPTTLQSLAVPLIVGTAVVVVTYLALNAAYLLVLPFSRVLTSTHIAYDATLTDADGDSAWTFGVAPMGPRSHAVLERGYDS